MFVMLAGARLRSMDGLVAIRSVTQIVQQIDEVGDRLISGSKGVRQYEDLLYRMGGYCGNLEIVGHGCVVGQVFATV